jgi:PadR family transcriptional regulator PadR
VGAVLLLRKIQSARYFPFAPTGEDRLTENADVMQGTLDLLILRALSIEPTHGWGITERVLRMSRDVFRIGQGSIYPALHRFDNRGWVTSYWRTTENNRIARYYELTAAGRHALSEEIARWRAYTSAVDLVIGHHQNTS